MDFDSGRPDQPLVVKCERNDYYKKISFKSAQRVTYDGLRNRIELAFSLSTQFSIRWTDDDGEHAIIACEQDLSEAIEYHKGASVGPSSSSASFLSSRSASSRRIVLEVKIDTDYSDTLSLSDTGSIASLDDYQDSPNGSRFTREGYSPPPLDDDAVTVNSKGTSSHSRTSKPETLIKKILKPARSRHFGFSSSRAQSAVSDGSVVEASQRGEYDSGPTAGPSSAAVFERLKRQDHDEPLHTLRTKNSIPAWLNEQSDQFVKTRLGAMPEPSDADTMSLNSNTTNSYSEDGDAGEDDGLSLELEGDSGKPQYVFSYTSARSGQSSSRESDIRQSLGYDADGSSFGQPPNASGASKDRPLSISTITTDSSALPDSTYPSSSETPSYRLSLTHSASDPLPLGSDQHTGGFRIPAELLIPEEVTDCSECGDILDSIKYTCTTCGEKTPVPRAELEREQALGKGKGRQISDESTVYGGEYPPRAHRSPISASSSFSSSSTYNQFYHKPLPPVPSTSPTDTVIGSGSGESARSHPRSNSSSSSGTLRQGYELCSHCFQTCGVDHKSSGSRGNSSPGLLDSPTSPQELALARRSAPKLKGQLRHAFSEKMWGAQGWDDVDQGDSQASKCSGCQSALSTQRYKCGICTKYTICRACFGEVHNIHPVHVFLQMTDQPTRSRSLPATADGPDGPDLLDAADEPSLKHPGVVCYHCGQDIVGALFRCVDCAPREVDICSNCETAGLPGNMDSTDGGHNSSHIMLKIPMPLSMTDVQSVSLRAHGLRNGRDQAHIRSLHSSPGSVASEAERTVSGTADGDDSHLMMCNSCGGDIVGERFQCLSCPSKPSSYNLCANCEKRSHLVHDPMHLFLKLRRPVDYKDPLESEFPLIPRLYSIPAGPTNRYTSMGADPEAYLLNLVHSFALCDRDLNRIRGKWFRCAYCAKDLCADCERVDTHDDTHAFLVLKAPVDMQSFRYVARCGSSWPMANGNADTLPIWTT
ncbi:hypothetical protein FA95DRAFT_1290328 [Auriscalpium vulgare]|uniref:Uncharacterized protein n=1 Tax=Auriscalpium vulgare TaxID=40419 RepID=A0ACB8RSH2_9AGAM|nr:hypothetical protein FA95DRAFT_1290328 [Auriscalpium vulgare]